MTRKTVLFLPFFILFSTFAIPNSTLQAQEQRAAQFFHIFQKTTADEKNIILEDGSIWQIGWWHTDTIKNWKPGNRLKISYHEAHSNHIKIENIDIPGTAWGSVYSNPDPDKVDEIARIPNGIDDPNAWSKLVLRNGLIFKSPTARAFFSTNWKIGDKIFILHDSDTADRYDLWNLNSTFLVKNCEIIGNEKPQAIERIVIQDILNLEEKLNRRIVDQPEATQSVSNALLKFCAGLKDPKTPISVFLFLGPTGVGKTELAKALNNEIYKTQKPLIRFEMSHFVEPHSITRLIGSPPGYVNHEQGGQLSESLKTNPQSVVLLDEVEKAHSDVRKLFLPIFDEGYIIDSKNHKIFCNDVVFIMTSNMCSQEILQLFNQGYSSEQVLEQIEPFLIQALSPELYARVEPILFRPLMPTAMERLVDLMLDEIIQRCQLTREIDLSISNSVKEYLTTHGYHPMLGARPLKNLIQKTVVSTLSYALIQNDIPNGSRITIDYSKDDDEWSVFR